MQRVPERLLELRDDAAYYDGVPFTGIAYAEDDAGHPLYEVSYRDGVRWGLSREWYHDGRLCSESSFVREWAHGRFRQWHGNGQLAEQQEYEWGVLHCRKAWDEEGRLLEDYTLAESSPEFTMLKERRAKRGQAEPR
jgi:antitoxin component YwqK of YwqJK toxin-antitoxin module